MTWFLVLISINLYADGTAEHYILTKPTFVSLSHCQESAYINRERVVELANENLGGPANVYCFTEKKLKEYINKFGILKPIKKFGI